MWAKLVAMFRPLSLGQTRIFGVLNSLDMTAKCMKLLVTVPPGVACLYSDEPPSLAGTLIGYLSPLSFAQMRNARAVCLKLFVQEIFRARSFALAKAGRSKPAKMAMMAITTNNSMSVNALIVYLTKPRFISPHSLLKYHR